MSITINSTNNNLGNGYFYNNFLASPSDIDNMILTPITYLNAPGSNLIYLIKGVGLNIIYNTTAYSRGDLAFFLIDSSVVGGPISANLITPSYQSCWPGLYFNVSPTMNNSIRNMPVTITNQTQAFSNGDSNIRFWSLSSVVNFASQSTQNSVNNIANLSIRRLEITLPSSIVQNLGSTPYSLLSAPGSNIAIIPTMVTFVMPYQGTQYNSVNLSLVYHGQSTAIMTLGSPGSFMNANKDAMQSVPNATYTNYNTANATNLGLDLIASGACGSGNSPIKVILEYSLISLP